MKKYLIIFLLVSTFLIVAQRFDFLNLENLRKSRLCRAKQTFTEASFDGEVVSKYRDNKNHNVKTVEIRSKDLKTTKIVYLHWDHSSVFERIEKGDFLRKDLNSTQLIIISDSGTSIYELDFKCSE
jgi:major membrane immunogen (membrane-anchored lipoprotein)